MEKTIGEELQKKLFDEKKLGFEIATEEEKEKIFSFNDDYINYLNKSKTERLFAKNAEELLMQNGFTNIEETDNLKPGDKVYFINRKKAVYAAVIGKNPLIEGLNLIGAHIDSPRLDLKPNPLYEDNDLALLKTHY